MSQNLMGASNALPQVLVSQQLAAAETTQYACPASTTVKLAAASLANTSASAVTVSVSIVKTGGTAGAANRVATFSLASGDSTTLDEVAGHFLGPGDFLSAIASAATSVALVLSGVVFS